MSQPCEFSFRVLKHFCNGSLCVGKHERTVFSGLVEKYLVTKREPPATLISCFENGDKKVEVAVWGRHKVTATCTRVSGVRPKHETKLECMNGR